MNFNRSITALLAVLAVVAGMWFLRETYVVTMPLAAAAFTAAVVWPVYRWSVRWIPRRLKTLALPLSMALVILAAAIFLGAIATALALAINRAPQYAGAVQHLWHRVADWAGSHGLPLRQLAAGGADGQLPGWVRDYITYGLSSLWSLLGFMVLIFFFTALMLLEARHWGDKTRAAFTDERAWKVVDATRTTARKVRDYLLTQTLISLASGIVEGTFLWLMGVELAFAWGLLFFLLNYIPNIGSAVAIVPPTLVTLATQGVWWAAAVLAGFMVLETLIGYVVAPLWQGRNLAMSPVIILLSVVFWGWVWGPVGAVLGVPLTAAILIACAHVESLRPLALLLSHTSDERELDRQTSSEGKA